MRGWRYIDGGQWRTTAEESIEPVGCNEYPRPDERLVSLRDVVERIEREAAEVVGDDDYAGGLRTAAQILENEFGGSE